MSVKLYAEEELRHVIKTLPNTALKHFTEEIIAMCDAFDKFELKLNELTVPFVAKTLGEVIISLCLKHPLSPLTGENEEWEILSNGCYQNKRCSSIFKDNFGKVFNTRAILWKDTNGQVFYGAVESITSKQYIKQFPFFPKTFVVTVENYVIKDKTQLKDVEMYYDGLTKL